MATVKLRNNISLGDYSKPYIVAELNTSHFGKIENAKTMVVAAKKSGCNCVKFQSWTEGTLYSENYYQENPIAQRFVKKFSFSEDQLKELSDFCKELGVDFASTPYSAEEADFLVKECNVPYLKVASMDVNNLPFLEHIGRLNVPIVLSTGMSELEEIKLAVEVIKKTGNSKIIILHCVSIYPVDPEGINLLNIEGLRAVFPDNPIGYSDHSVGTEMAVASIALGACLVEKHFTLDNKAIGMDNQMATEPGEMKLLVDSCQNVFRAMGNHKRTLLEGEIKQRLVMRRSIVASKNLKAGTVLKREDLDFKRPGSGIPPDKTEAIIGKILTQDIDAGFLITNECFNE
ncbi:MAG: sialic acid synthase SpsE [Luteibaculaceae bacterium]|jgi:sialic acid synthase SpsE